MSQPPQSPFPGGNNPEQPGGQYPQGGEQYPQGGGQQFPQDGGQQYPQGGGQQYPQGGGQQFPQGQPQVGGQVGGPGGIQFENQAPQQAPQQGGGFLKSVGGRILSAVISIVVVVALALAFTVGRSYFDKKGMEDQVGTCAVLTGTGDEVDTETVDCGSEDFHYQIVATAENASGCPEGNYTTLTTTRSNRGSESTVGTLCMMAVLKADTCYAEDTGGSNELKVVECTDPSAAFKVGEVLDANDVSQCEYSNESLSFAEPAKTYCLVPPA